MDLLIDIALVAAAAGALVAAASLVRFAWRMRQRERDRNAQLLDSVYNQQTRRRRGE